jgi:hypothetical protein
MSGGGMMSRAVEGQGQAQGGAGYSAPPASNPYQSAFNSQQGSQQRAMSPLVQQQMMRQQQGFNPMQQQSSGIEAAIMQMLSSQNQPMMRPQMQQMPQYRSPALGYRPDMTRAQQGLSQVAPSVILQQRQAAEAEAARIQAEQEAAAQQPQFDYNSYYSGG